MAVSAIVRPTCSSSSSSKSSSGDVESQADTSNVNAKKNSNLCMRLLWPWAKSETVGRGVLSAYKRYTVGKEVLAFGSEMCWCDTKLCGQLTSIDLIL